jgi:hypothetical protein
MESMNVVGQGLDERGRRPWEGSSRTDIRSGGCAAQHVEDLRALRALAAKL